MHRILDPLKHGRTHPGEFTLTKIRTLLDRLGNPERRLPPVIHVAGTNGKGSLVAFLRAFHEAAGRRVHLYTSPDLVRVNERIYVAGADIADEPLAALLEECERAGSGLGIQHFEILTASAFLAFTRTPGDVTLLETGLGGRLDATNVVDRPALTALTPISLDHMAFLGDTVALIAKEKAAIMKPGVPSVIGPQPPEALAVIEARATEVGAPLSRCGREWRATATAGGMVYESTQGRRELPKPGLIGLHQVPNAATAIACTEAVPALPVGLDAIRTGLATVRWPARMQRLARGPLVDLLTADWEVWLDGTHNEDGARVIAETFRSWPARPLYLVFGVIKSHDPRSILRQFKELVTAMRALAIPGDISSHDAATIVAGAEAEGIEVAPATGLAEAVAGLKARHGENGPARLLICGSLYLAGAVLKENG
ncbi:MAG: bifunctional folylpolyglutamate synthase/dihydrofolate synthase [Proteobacteria bacterium]|nr:bifunctional folylpolyglutamate synthase/dihydrofolate synthase [Pseudomonadota bacterium]MBI3498535.1 bifunctional folylpolyglutamate synthase/dihydrofolate synthase [Pseudomonadota bacterium]